MNVFVGVRVNVFMGVDVLVGVGLTELAKGPARKFWLTSSAERAR